MVRFPLDTDEDPARTPPQTESAKERGFRRDDVPPDFGEASNKETDCCDTADEGPGHRG